MGEKPDKAPSDRKRREYVEKLCLPAVELKSLCRAIVAALVKHPGHIRAEGQAWLDLVDPRAADVELDPWDD